MKAKNNKTKKPPNNTGGKTDRLFFKAAIKVSYLKEVLLFLRKNCVSVIVDSMHLNIYCSETEQDRVCIRVPVVSGSL